MALGGLAILALALGNLLGAVTPASAARAVTPASATPAPADSPAAIVFTRFDSAAAFGAGTSDGTLVEADHLRLADGLAHGTWVSPWVDPGFAYTELIASWNADTPGASWLRVEAQATTAGGRQTNWYTLGIWAAGEAHLKRTSVRGQADQDARVETDTLFAVSQPLAGYRLRVTLERPASADAPPMLRMLGAVASNGGATFGGQASPTVGDMPVELGVPAYSQEIHAGQYPEWGGGGAQWCSPTSTAMVLAFWGAGPSSDELGWVDPADADPAVDAAARGTYDAAFRGTGNWPFNTAYAGRFGLDAFVTQLRSLAEAEAFVRAGIPVIASLRPGVFGLDGYLFPGSSEGHLLVIQGFDDTGNPIVNDPAALSDARVRRVYDRAQFERAWLGGSGGAAYVIHPISVPLPPPPAGATHNW